MMRSVAITLVVLALGVLPAIGGKSATARAATVCTWGGTPDHPTGVFIASPGVTNSPSPGPIEFKASGRLGGPEDCKGTLTFRGVIAPGMSCAIAQPFHATATGLPPLKYIEGSFGVAGTQPVLMYDRDRNLVGSEQAQFLTGAVLRPKGSDPLADCNSPEGMRRAYWSDTIELLPPST